MNVLAVVAHPDDEVLGCGGTLAKHAEAGDTVQVIVCCKTKADEGLVAAAKTLGVRFWSRLGFNDQMLDMVPIIKLQEAITYRLVESSVSTIYTHNPDDLNLDHAIVARAVLTAFRAPHSHANIYAMEVLSSTEFGPTAFQPNHWEILTLRHANKKADALACYASEQREYPHPRSSSGIINHARWRGQQVCRRYAEAFRALRTIR